MNKIEAIEALNKMGKEKTPFFFLIDYKMENCIVCKPNEAKSLNILFNFNGTCNYDYFSTSKKNIFLKPVKISFSDYQKAFDIVKQELCYGNSYLVNLTFPTPLACNSTLNDIFQNSKAKYKIFAFDKFVVFSPEPFVKIENGIISTYPMKGTIDAQTPNARNVLLNNKKEMAEHATIVDLLRNDLSRISSEVKVKKYRYVEEISALGKKLLQVSSHIEGHLPNNYLENIGSILFDMLPAGSVTGAPKPKTVEIISNAESYNRGFYTGISGLFDGTKLDSCVLIRFIEKNEDGKLIYKSGGGITSQSIIEQEYNELNDKIYVPIA